MLSFKKLGTSLALALLIFGQNQSFAAHSCEDLGEFSFSTARTQVRPVRPEDAPAFKRILLDPKAHQMSGDVLTEKDAEEVVNTAAPRADQSWKNLSFTILSKETGKIIGALGFIKMTEVPGILEQLHSVKLSDDYEDWTMIAFTLAQEEWGKGFMTEVASEASLYSSKLGVKELFAVIYPINGASQRVLEKAGFKKIGSTLQFLFFEYPASKPKPHTPWSRFTRSP